MQKSPGKSDQLELARESVELPPPKPGPPTCGQDACVEPLVAKLVSRSSSQRCRMRRAALPSLLGILPRAVPDRLRCANRVCRFGYPRAHCRTVAAVTPRKRGRRAIASPSPTVGQIPTVTPHSATEKPQAKRTDGDNSGVPRRRVGKHLGTGSLPTQASAQRKTPDKRGFSGGDGGI